MKTKLLAVFTLITAFFLSSCAMLIGTRDVDFPLERLQQSLNKRLPFTKRYLGLIEVTASHAQLAFDQPQGRLLVDMDVTMGLPITGKSWSGKLSMSGVIALDVAQNAVVLNDARLDKVALDNLDTAYSGQAMQIGNLLARELLQSVPLYRFKPEDLRYVGVTFAPTKIVTKADRLVVTFEPQK
ncbi:DUF1439 domain-containing protein [Glaciimonas immobilis]|uniref:DUF1439 domain-containing protein n=1 Tax=Glaciimonas immobilis TaxID=728004 RepID=A0A840RT89_9BURK|nr:DUF1439 domain-containing protein [Glaciimonas immobilis]KAF3997465.1 DUF1439 domain-containing protein [Glaciimonas immobilis]MBB5200863.1 hypothetical protein [Glaciimonas immobilis]